MSMYQYLLGKVSTPTEEVSNNTVEQTKYQYLLGKVSTASGRTHRSQTLIIVSISIR